MHDLPVLIGVVGVVLLLIVRAIMRASGGSFAVIRETAFGARARERPMDAIASYWRDSAPTESGVDDRTWTDLDLDEVFATLDRTGSAAGQQLLYARLRNDRFDAAALARFDRAASRFERDEELRALVRGAVRRLDDGRVYSLPRLFFRELPSRPAYWPVFPLLTLAAVACILLVDTHPRAWLALLVVAIANVALGVALRERIEPVAGAIRMTAELVRVARQLASVQSDEIDDELAVLRRHVGELKRVKFHTGWLSFEPGQANELASTLYEYANLLLGLNLNAFAFGIEEIRRQRLRLRAVYEAIGAIDSVCAIGAWRASLERWTRPTFISRAREMQCDGIVHPLLESAVPNALHVDGRSIFVTGSNMSGKTTFIRAVGINAVLAQTVCTVVADRWTAPPLDVRTSIGRTDDVLSGKSYYLAEVESIGRLVSAARDGRQHLFLIDEIFRGTNTTERIAAGSAVLTWLHEGDNIVLVATHDLEALALLGGRYEPHHFREQVEDDGLSFDYRMRPGISSTRNAIALLRLMRFPEPLVHDAMTLAARIEGAPPAAAHQSPA
jgi:hypothetical protein